MVSTNTFSAAKARKICSFTPPNGTRELFGYFRQWFEKMAQKTAILGIWSNNTFSKIDCQTTHIPPPPFTTPLIHLSFQRCFSTFLLLQFNKITSNRSPFSTFLLKETSRRKKSRSTTKDRIISRQILRQSLNYDPFCQF